MIQYDSKSWLRICLSLRGSVIPGLAVRLVVVVVISALAVWLHDAWAFKIPGVAHTFIGVALGLLLVFRTNSSYDRYWEGRRLFGTLVNRSRDLARQVVTFIDGDDEAAHRDRATLIRLINLMFALVRQHLRGERALDVHGEHITADERDELEPVACRPTVVATWMSARLVGCVRAGRLSEERLRAMDGSISGFVDAWGGAERIWRTPIPFAYAHHIKVLLVVFCFTAPFAIVEAMGWATPIAAALLAFGLFGIDEIGVEIEEPFGYDPNDLPLDAIGATIARDIDMLLALRHQPAHLAAPGTPDTPGTPGTPASA